MSGGTFEAHNTRQGDGLVEDGDLEGPVDSQIVEERVDCPSVNSKPHTLQLFLFGQTERFHRFIHRLAHRFIGECDQSLVLLVNEGFDTVWEEVGVKRGCTPGVGGVAIGADQLRAILEIDLEDRVVWLAGVHHCGRGSDFKGHDFDPFLCVELWRINYCDYTMFSEL